MFSIELKSKGTVTVDLEKLTVADIRTLTNAKTKQAEQDRILGLAVGLSEDELTAMPYPEFRKLTRFFWQCVNDPLKDDDNAKNSQSESTSE